MMLNSRRGASTLLRQCRRSPLFARCAFSTTSGGGGSDGKDEDASNDADGDTSSQAPCDVIQGPSQLRTPVYRPSPSLLSLPGLRSLPFWTSYDAKSDTNRIAYQDPKLKRILDHLEGNVAIIQKEYQQRAMALPSDYQDSNDHGSKLHTGTWDWHSYMNKGSTQASFAFHFPKTVQVLEQLGTDLFEGTPFGFAFFSTLHPQSKIQPHTSPINFRLRIHLPLYVPSQSEVCGIRVANQVKEWVPGKALVLDDSYEHEVWNESAEDIRVLLLIDVWHPDVHDSEKAHIVKLFQDAQAQGMWK